MKLYAVGLYRNLASPSDFGWNLKKKKITKLLHEYLHVNLECNRYKLLNQNCIVKYQEKKN